MKSQTLRWRYGDELDNTLQEWRGIDSSSSEDAFHDEETLRQMGYLPYRVVIPVIRVFDLPIPTVLVLVLQQFS